MAIVCDSDFEPDDLQPEFMKAQTMLFELERPFQDLKKGGKKKGKQSRTPGATEDQEMEMAKLQARIERIEKDVLFDRGLVELVWRTKKIELEKDFIAKKQQAAKPPEPREPEPEPEPSAEQPDAAGDASAEDNDDIALQAEKMAADILAQDDDSDDALGDLFASLPVTDVDPVTGESRTVVNSSSGPTIVIRDFEKWSGVSPMRALEEACRSR
ncbi:hypothetical protein IMZ48_13175 [Candidatus Bathyarchaeota archaeon]|nr:hypothetical protein [Candidatus Bathyarchaeota archaeon]